jgi:ubiquinol-cytochrome c reductase subunit 6
MGGAKRSTESVLMCFVEQDEESSDKNEDEGSEDKEEPEEEEEELEDPKEKFEEGKCIYFSTIEVCFHIWN